MEAERRIFPLVHQEVPFVLSKAHRVAAFRPSARLNDMYGPQGATSPTDLIFPRIDADKRGVMQLCFAVRADWISLWSATLL
jgi:hypothetical protein